MNSKWLLMDVRDVQQLLEGLGVEQVLKELVVALTPQDSVMGVQGIFEGTPQTVVALMAGHDSLVHWRLDFSSLALEHLVAAGSTFRQVVCHARVVEQACIETYSSRGASQVLGGSMEGYGTHSEQSSYQASHSKYSVSRVHSSSIGSS
uniref:Uncharacterized protein n=1 Tax=Solanum tuberosum TaxID=4113 RepID=M1DGN5_SOLTU